MAKVDSASLSFRPTAQTQMSPPVISPYQSPRTPQPCAVEYVVEGQRIQHFSGQALPVLLRSQMGAQPPQQKHVHHERGQRMACVAQRGKPLTTSGFGTPIAPPPAPLVAVSNMHPYMPGDTSFDHQVVRQFSCPTQRPNEPQMLTPPGASIHTTRSNLFRTSPAVCSAPQATSRCVPSSHQGIASPQLAPSVSDSQAEVPASFSDCSTLVATKSPSTTSNSARSSLGHTSKLSTNGHGMNIDVDGTLEVASASMTRPQSSAQAPTHEDFGTSSCDDQASKDIAFDDLVTPTFGVLPKTTIMTSGDEHRTSTSHARDQDCSEAPASEMDARDTPKSQACSLTPCAIARGRILSNASTVLVSNGTRTRCSTDTSESVPEDWLNDTVTDQSQTCSSMNDTCARNQPPSKILRVPSPSRARNRLSTTASEALSEYWEDDSIDMAQIKAAAMLAARRAGRKR